MQNDPISASDYSQAFDNAGHQIPESNGYSAATDAPTSNIRKDQDGRETGFTAYGPVVIKTPRATSRLTPDPGWAVEMQIQRDETGGIGGFVATPLPAGS